MFKKCIITVLTLAMVSSSFVCTFGASKQVAATIPSFPVTLNELKFNNNDQEKYPLLVYRNITYFPMTYYQSNLLNLNTSWTAEGGLIIQKGNPETPKEFSYEAPASKKNSNTQTVTIIDSKVTVNGKVIDNTKEPYPLLCFRDIIYFPLTWRFAVEEFGWNYTFNNKEGLNIRADNFFYTANGDSYKSDSGEFVTVKNETHYLKGDLRVLLKTDTVRLLGPVSGNLSIEKNGVETKPDGYFGYYQKNGPLFTLDGNSILTTYYTDPDIRNAQPCRVDIETGQIL